MKIMLEDLNEWVGFPCISVQERKYRTLEGSDLFN